MSDSVLTQQHGNILEIALNRPEVYNALNLDMMKLLAETLSFAAADQTIKGILLTGKGKASHGSTCNEPGGVDFIAQE